MWTQRREIPLERRICSPDRANEFTLIVGFPAGWNVLGSDAGIERRQPDPKRAFIMSPKFLRIAVVLGLLSAIGPFAIDMYLPA
ncbi:MAG: hypothetical protein E5W28_07790, partial [Mesorhizobium sp.]